MKTTLGLVIALVALSPPARAGSQGAVSGTAELNARLTAPAANACHPAHDAARAAGIIVALAEQLS